MTVQRSINTHLNADTMEQIEIFDGNTRDQIIIIREAISSLRSTDTREVQIDLTTKAWTMKVTVRRA